MSLTQLFFKTGRTPRASRTPHCLRRASVALFLAASSALALLGSSGQAQAYTGEQFTVVNWQGYVYEFHRHEDARLHYKRAPAPTSPGSSVPTMITPEQDPFEAHSPYPGGQFYWGGGSSGPEAGIMVTDYPVSAQAAPIAFRTGAQGGPQGSPDSLSVMWLRNTAGFPGARNDPAFASLTSSVVTTSTITKEGYSPGNYVSFNTARDDVTLVNDEWRMDKGVPQVGAAPLPNRNAVITAHPAVDRTGIYVAWWTFGDGRFPLAPNPEARPAKYPLPPGVGTNNWDGNIDLSTAINMVDSSRDPSRPFILWLSLRSADRVWVGSARIGDARSNLSIRWTQMPIVDNPLVSNGVEHSKLHTDPANRTFLDFSQKTLNAKYLARRVQLSGSPDALVLGSADTFNDEVKLGNSSRAPDVVYSFSTPPAPTDSEIFVDAYHNFVNFDGDLTFITRKTGRARRSALIKTVENSGQRYPLVGIIEGPPPVPNENLSEVPDSRMDSTIASMTYGSKVGSDTETTIKGKAGIIAKAEGAVGTPLGKVEAEGETSLLFGGGKTTFDSSSVLTSDRAMAKVINDYPGRTMKMVRPDGLAFLWQSGFAGFNYQMVDDSGKQFPGTLSYLQLQPYQPRIVAHPFSFNPDAPAPGSGIIPGQIQSYLIDPATLNNDIANSMMTMQGNNIGHPYVVTSWTTAGGSTQEVATLTKTEHAFTINFDFQAMVGGTVGSKELGTYADVKAGIKGNLDYETKTGDETEETLTTEVDTPTSYLPGAYTNYTYMTFLLKSDNQHEQNLLQLLQSFKDPSGNNQRLLSILQPGASPWQVSYAIAVGDYAQIPGTASNAAPSNRVNMATPNLAMGTNPAVAAVPLSLQQQGIDSPAKAGLLWAAVRNLDRQKQAAQTGAFMTLKPLKGMPDNINKLAAGLTPQQRADLTKHIKTTQAQNFRSFRQKYPTWKGRTWYVKSSTATNAPLAINATTKPAQTQYVPLRQRVLAARQRRLQPATATKPVQNVVSKATPALSMQAMQQLLTP